MPAQPLGSLKPPVLWGQQGSSLGVPTLERRILRPREVTRPGHAASSCVREMKPGINHRVTHGRGPG